MKRRCAGWREGYCLTSRRAGWGEEEVPDEQRQPEQRWVHGANVGAHMADGAELALALEGAAASPAMQMAGPNESEPQDGGGSDQENDPG